MDRTLNLISFYEISFPMFILWVGGPYDFLKKHPESVWFFEWYEGPPSPLKDRAILSVRSISKEVLDLGLTWSSGMIGRLMVLSEPIWIRNIPKYLARTGFTLIHSQCMVWLLLMAKSNLFVQKEELTEQNALNAKLVNSAFQLPSKVKLALKNRVHHILSRNPNFASVLLSGAN